MTNLRQLLKQPLSDVHLGVIIFALIVALAGAGAASARVGGSDVRLAVTRVVVGGAAGLALTYAIGHLFGTAVGSESFNSRGTFDPAEMSEAFRTLAW